MKGEIFVFLVLSSLALVNAGNKTMFDGDYEVSLWTTSKYIYVSMSTTYNGYAAVGFNATSMYEADVIVFFRKDDGSVDFYDYYFEDGAPPTLDTALGGTNNWEEVDSTKLDDGFEITVRRELDTGEDADYVFEHNAMSVETIDIICSAHDSASTISKHEVASSAEIEIDGATVNGVSLLLVVLLLLNFISF